MTGAQRAAAERPTPHAPLVSIITVVYNGAPRLERTIRSVLGQSYGKVEYLIIDGGSTDGTVEIIKRYRDRLAYWVSEPDQGIADAFNKGIRAASGELIGLINADDWYPPDAVATVVSRLEGIGAFCYGGCTYVDSRGRERYLPPVADYGRQIAKYMPRIHHPTVFVRRETYERYGLFDTRYRYAMDYDFFLRLYRHGCVGTPIDRNLAFMEGGGVSDRMYLGVRREVCRISQSHGLPRPAALLYCYLLIGKHLARRLLSCSATS